MPLKKLNLRLKKIINEDALEREMWRFIQDQLQGVIMFYQRKQLFKDSIGADSRPLGFYGSGGQIGKAKFKKVGKRTGKRFTMIDTGDFKDKLVVTIDRRRREIRITSTTSHLNEMLDNPVFITHNFFGLTFENTTHLINLHIKKHLQQWTKQQLSLS